MTPLSRDLHPSNGRRLRKDEVVVSITAAQLQRDRRQAQAPQEPHEDPQEPTLDQRQIELLRLLAEGSDDEMAARRLGLELPGLRQMLLELGAELGACNRFQLALRAREEGWV